MKSIVSFVRRLFSTPKSTPSSEPLVENSLLLTPRFTSLVKTLEEVSQPLDRAPRVSQPLETLESVELSILERAKAIHKVRRAIIRNKRVIIEQLLKTMRQDWVYKSDSFPPHFLVSLGPVTVEDFGSSHCNLVVTYKHVEQFINVPATTMIALRHLLCPND